MRAPFRPRSSAAIGQVVRARLHALGLSLRHYGSHVLRYACASHLLEEGLSLKEIGDHLGHRDTNTTRGYTRIDLGEPAPRCRPGPGGSAVKLQDMVDRYVSYRQAMGDGFASAAKDLRCFARFIGPAADLGQSGRNR